MNSLERIKYVDIIVNFEKQKSIGIGQYGKIHIHKKDN